MLSKASVAKLTKNYVDFKLEKCAENIDKKIEQLKDEKAMALILKAIQETLCFLEDNKEQVVSYELCSHNISYPSCNMRLEIQVNVAGETYNALVEELDGSEVCNHYMHKLAHKKDSNGENDLISNYGKFMNKTKEFNFIQLGNAYLGKEVTSKLLESLIDVQYHV